MKVALLADIHSNLLALERVLEHIEAWRPDWVVVAGDVVNRGPRPAECLALIQERQQAAGWLVVRGNHEDYVLYQASGEAPREGPRFEIFRNSFWTYRQLNGQVAALDAMPFQVAIPAPDGRELRVVHASMRGNQDGIFPDTPDDELRCQIGPPPAVLAVGHTHIPLVRRLGDSLVVNCGAVGAPFDGDRRAAYAQLTWRQGQWSAEIVRLAYDWEAALRDYAATGFVPAAGALASLMQLEFQQARPHLHRWLQRYEAAVVGGELSTEESVRRYLQQPGGAGT
jgi:predicted phosphodiesterase